MQNSGTLQYEISYEGSDAGYIHIMCTLSLTIRMKECGEMLIYVHLSVTPT